MLETVPRRKIRDQVADRIKHFIATKGLIPGDSLPTETELAQQLGVSRLSVREATKALEFLGIVESKTGVGLAVGLIELTRVTDHLGFHPALHSADPVQMIESRIILETGIVPHVVLRMTEDPSIEEKLQGLVDQSRSVRDLQTWIDLDIQFHRTLLEASGLAPLIAFGELLQVFFQRFRASVKAAEWKRGIASHQQIIELLSTADIEGSILEIRSHIASHKNRLGA